MAYKYSQSQIYFLLVHTKICIYFVSLCHHVKIRIAASIFGQSGATLESSCVEIHEWRYADLNHGINHLACRPGQIIAIRWNTSWR